MKIGLSTSVILNILLLAVILILRECSPGCPDCPETKDSVSVTNTTDTVRIPGKNVPYPEPYETIKPIPVISYINLTKEDSARIVSKYQELNKYDLAVLDDSNGKVNVLVNVQYNKIKDWTPKVEIYSHKTSTETFHQPVLRNKVFIGFRTGMIIPENNVILAPTIVFCTKRDHLYAIDYDPFNQIAGLSVLWKIRLKK